MADGGEQGRKRDLEHLKPWQWKPGQSGNPSGRPKGSLSIVRILRQKLSAGDEDGACAVADRLIEVALSGEDQNALRALKDIVDRIDGTPVREMKLTGDLHAKLVRLEGDDDDSGQSAEDNQ